MTKKLLKPEQKKKLIWASVFASLLVIAYGIFVLSGLPSLEQLENPRPELATKIYSIDGEVLDQFYIKNRTQVSLSDLPPHLVDALIATEDKNFYEHWGVDLRRFVTAMVKNVFTLRLREGASTITQQLARNLYGFKGESENVFSKATRKIREFITAVQIERNYTKQEIIEMYLSVAYFGRSAYGIASASEIYFDKKPIDLSLTESALLIGMLKGPGTYDPYKKFERAIGRRNTVLGQMIKYNYITEAEEQRARIEPIILHPLEEQRTGLAPHFVEYIRQQLIQKAETYGFDIYRDGLSVYTTLDSRMQQHANRAVDEHLTEYQKMFDKSWNWKYHPHDLKKVISHTIRTLDVYRDAPEELKDSIAKALKNNPEFVDSVKRATKQIEVGFVALDHRTGNILAMVGGSQFKVFKYGLNHVTQTKRQPGSTFKPFVFTVAIDNGYAPSYEILNQPVTVMLPGGKRWTPQNFDGTFGGKLTIREGFTYSINLVAIRTMMEIAPVQQVIEYAHRMGIKSDLPPYESLAIGTGEVVPLDIVSAFGVYANEGVHVEPISILKIIDKNGSIIEENFPSRREVLNPETAYIITDMMEDVVNSGSAARIRSMFHLPAAGKTGTTQEYADAWFIGYTPHITAGVWVGFDNKTVHFTSADGQGGRAAAPIWGKFMKYTYEDGTIGMPLGYFNQPEGVVRDTICAETKKLATEYCPNKIEELFNRKYRPEACPKHTSWRWKEEEEAKSPIN
ncbi:MAG: PBP1A family penicillin-binding protein [Ignavibacteriae bacterium]|nr:PBP1A family penicillin-binding protein [Ignavibacteriota bacterium]